MKSSIKIDFIDRGTGIGVEPVIRIELIKSEDPRDTLISVLFENLRSQSYLQLHYAHHKPVAKEGLPDFEKTIYLFKSEIDTDSLMEIVKDGFNSWAAKEKYVTVSDGWLNRGDKNISRKDLFNEFISLKTSHAETPLPK